MEGVAVGSAVGCAVGCPVGCSVGCCVGCDEGCCVGCVEGCCVGCGDTPPTWYEFQKQHTRSIKIKGRRTRDDLNSVRPVAII